MPRQRPRILFATCLCMLLACMVIAPPGHAAPRLTQHDWMVILTDSLGWSFGLPDEPVDQDYINILSGRRHFRFEAEEVYAPDEDEVSVMSFKNFGAFSGDGWLQGISKPVEVHLRFILPIEGAYRIHAALRRSGHRLHIGDRVVEVAGAERFGRQDLGTFSLPAGRQEILLELPADGSIDYIELEAPNLPPIMPRTGWQPDRPLEWDDIGVTLVQTWQLADLLGTTGHVLTLEAEDAQSDHADTVDIPHLGKPSGGLWLRATSGQASVNVTFELPDGGFYDGRFRVMGNPVEIEINDHRQLTLAANPYLDDFDLPPLLLKTGANRIELELPPGGGADRFTLLRKQDDPAHLRNLIGLQAQGPHPEAQDLDRLTRLLAAFGATR